jgi:glycosyltransferase involved in cell wall biosynthesis
MLPTPPKGYGGIELLTHYLCRGLEELGCRVTLIAAPGSRFRRLVEAVDEYEAAVKAAIIHEGCDALIDRTHRKTLSLLAVDKPLLNTVYYTDEAGRGVNIYPSKAVWKSYGGRGEVIYDGIDTSIYTPSKSREEYFLAFSRIAPIKGIHLVVDIFKRINKPLKVAGHTGFFSYDRKYVEDVREKCTGKIEFVGDVDPETKIDLLAHAKALVMLPLWLESSCIAFMEALASGCPVVTWDYGSPREIVKHKVTGYVAERGNIKQVEKYILEIDEINNGKCVESAEYFSYKRMAQDYLKLLKRYTT